MIQLGLRMVLRRVLEGYREDEDCRVVFISRVSFYTDKKVERDKKI